MIPAQNNLGYKGTIATWNTSKGYKIGDLAVLNGVLYIAKADNTGQNPSTDTTHTYWQIVVNTGNKDLVIKIEIADLDATGFTPVAGTLYQHNGASAANYKINGIYYATATGSLIDAFAAGSEIFIQYVDQTTAAFPTTRPDGSALKNEDYVKPSATATLPFTLGTVTFKNVNDKARYNGTTWYLEPAFPATGNVSVTDASKESIAGDKTTQAEINEELVKAVKENIARYLTKDAAGNAFATHAELTAATTFYYGGTVATPDAHDYAIVSNDEDHNYAQSRYVFQPSTTTPPGTWAFQFVYSSGIADDSLVATSTGIKVQLKALGSIGLDSTTAGDKGLFVKLKANGGLVADTSTGELSVKHVFTAFSIATTDWTDSVNADFETNFKATITVTGLTTNDVISTYFANTCALAAGNSGVIADISAANTITFYCVEKPTVAISGKYEILVSA